MDTNKLINLLPELATFVTVVEQGNFAASAEKLGVAPSSVSRSIAKLEEKLTCRLIERTTRKMSITPIGNEVYTLANEMLKSAQQAVNATLMDTKNLSGKLRIAVPKALANQVLAPYFLDFIEQHPEVELHLKVVDHFIDPISDEVDIVIHIAEQPIESLISKTLRLCPLILCASPQYLQTQSIPTHPAELKQHKCIRLGESASDGIWHFSNGKESHAVPIQGRMSVNHSEIRRKATLQGLGISLFPEFVVQENLKEKELVEVLSDWKLKSRYQGKIFAQYVQSKFVPHTVKHFIQFLEAKLI